MFSASQAAKTTWSSRKLKSHKKSAPNKHQHGPHCQAGKENTVRLLLSKQKSLRQKTIKKLKRHTENKTCPKSLQYAARANIPPDDEFKNEIKAIKQTAEQAFVHALSKFHHRRLGRQESQLSKKSQSAPKSKGFNKPLQERNVTTAKAKSAARTNNLEQIQEQLNEMREMMYKMQKCVNNKTVEHYHCLFSEYSTTETGLSKKQE